MSITAIVQNGKVELPGEVDWPSGTIVRVEKISNQPSATLAESLAGFIGMADDLPPDLAENLDHYTHGHPKQ